MGLGTDLISTTQSGLVWAVAIKKGGFYAALGVRAPCLVPLCTHLDSHICQPQPLLPFLLPRSDTPAPLAACFSSYACPSILTLMLNSQTGTVVHGVEVGGQTGREAGWGWGRGGHAWMSAPVVFLHAWTSLTALPLPRSSDFTLIFPLKLVFPYPCLIYFMP